MSAEAEKVISMSLCKMAESRGVRRGGTSLHKHLLIASVLTKATRARTAFLDTCYMGDDASERDVDLNLSYQEEDFPSDELDSTVGEGSELDIDPSIIEQVTALTSSGIHNVLANNNNNNGNTNATSTTGDSRYVAEVESEIDLPPDILSCVEKLGDLNERIFSSTQQSASDSSESTTASSNQSSKSTTCSVYEPPSSKVAPPDVIPNPQPISPVAANNDDDDIHEDSQLSSALMYLDLDAGSCTVVERGPVATSTPTKRRREWCFEDEDEDDVICGSSGLCIETPVKSQPNSRNNMSNFAKNCKRLRFDSDMPVRCICNQSMYSTA
ncbi:hypothetical protein Ocin01_19373 [Orchesella cincta]|uniref:Uncharacterized protein n=1 Tax=Orchesella cincta TaxID=48709 RepID=A0A1D2M2W3_ORCCI|nr:hypothetical protein Ocin01_19373 [Orchesella cincta]